MKAQDKIEEIFQENFKGFKVQPDASVWTGIESNIPTAPSGISTSLGNFGIAGKMVIGFAVVSGIALSAYLLNQEEAAPIQEKEEIIKEQTTPTTSKVEEMGSPLFADTVGIKQEVNTAAVETKSVGSEIDAKDIMETIELQATETRNEPAISEKASINTDSSKSTSDDAVMLEPNEAESQSNNINPASTTVSSDSEDIQENVIAEEPEVQKAHQPTDPKIQASSPLPEKDTMKEIHSVIPNIFTPNQDGTNDVFRIETEEATHIEVAVLDQNGRIIFEWEGLYGFWDGNMPNGDPAPEGNYFYRILLSNKDIKTTEIGSVILKR